MRFVHVPIVMSMMFLLQIPLFSLVDLSGVPSDSLRWSWFTLKAFLAGSRICLTFVISKVAQ